MRSRNTQFKGYKKCLPTSKHVIKQPKIYKVNGYYLVGEPLAVACRGYGMDVQEMQQVP